jgi:hypothetical protein
MPMNNKNLRSGGIYAALFIALCALIFFRFRNFFPSVFYGDDLAMYMYVHGAESNDPAIATLLGIIGMKFRPVFTTLLTAETLAFGKHLGRYLAINVLINALTGLAAFAVFSNLSKSKLIAGLLTAMLLTSRFALYQVTQVTGQVESVSFLFFVLTVFFVCKSVVEIEETNIRRFEWIALILAALAFHTHERYLVVLPWLLIVFFVTSNKTGWRHKAASAGVTIAVIAANAVIKHFAMHAAFFEGTGGKKITVSLPSIVDLASQAVLSIFGINHGPDFLIGIQWGAMPLHYQIVCGVFALLATMMAIASIIESRRTGAALISFPWLLVLAAAMLVAPATMTIRMEQRWELAPFFILLALISIWLGQQSRNSNRRVIAGAAISSLAICHFAIERVVSQNFSNIFMISEQTYARAVMDSVLLDGTTRRGQDVILIGDASHCKWGLMQGRGFFDFYEGASRKAKCVSTAEEALATSRDPVFAEASPAKLINVTRQIIQSPIIGDDLMSAYRSAQIQNSSPEDTPTHTGVFESNWDWMLGDRKTLVILSTHGLKYRDVRSKGQASLSIDAGMLFSRPDYSEVVVKLMPKDQHISPREISLRIQPLPAGLRANTSRFLIPLPELSKSHADISISVRTPSGNLGGAWVGFTSIQLVSNS